MSHLCKALSKATDQRYFGNATQAAEELLRQAGNISKHEVRLIASDGAIFVLFLHRLDDKWLLTVRFYLLYISPPVLHPMRSGANASTIARHINKAIRELRLIDALQRIGR